jgi:hypothetical protein
MNTHSSDQNGNTLMLVMVVVLAVLSVTFGGLAIWSYMQYQSKSTDVNGQIDKAVLEAKAKQASDDEEKYRQVEKDPKRVFVGPDDYGRLSFSYPKTWSTYIASDPTKGGTYKAYLNPVTVPLVNDATQFALRVTIENQDYDKVLSQYEGLIKKGDLRNGVTSSDGNSGTRLDGNFTKDIRGAAVIYKLRDKTITIRTDADTFKPDFEELIKTIKYNQ